MSHVEQTPVYNTYPLYHNSRFRIFHQTIQYTITQTIHQLAKGVFSTAYLAYSLTYGLLTSSFAARFSEDVPIALSAFKESIRTLSYGIFKIIIAGYCIYDLNYDMHHYKELSQALAYSRESDYQSRKAQAITNFQHIKSQHGQLQLKSKSSTHLWRTRSSRLHKLDLRNMNHILKIDPTTRTAEVEGMVNFFTLSQECLKYGLVPKVVPELRGITIGGAIAGLAVESSSFKWGLFHETVREMEVLTGEGKVVKCSKSTNPELFSALPNSYGTLGYVLRATVELIPAQEYVHVQRRIFNDPQAYFKTIQTLSTSSDLNFIDGAIFAKDKLVLITGTFTNEAPFSSNYVTDGIYYQSIVDPDKPEDYMKTEDYLWRWDRDCFWGTHSKPVLQNPVFRKTLGPYVLRSDILIKISRLNKKILRKNLEYITQDVGIPINKCADFIAWLDKNIQGYPLFICPIQGGIFPLWNLDEGKLSCDVGIFCSQKSVPGFPNYYNESIEKAVTEHQGLKSLYSKSCFDQASFDRIYNGEEYRRLKQQFDPEGIFPSLFEKCVLNK